MKIEDKLEIVIPTFNRCEKLGITFSYLLDENSLVKNCDITILDNCSTDDTPNLVKKIAEKHPNVRYRRNARNVGVWQNILRSHEVVSKEYFWILGDNDTYNWECWSEVAKGIEDGADGIVVSYGGCKWKPKDLRAWIILPGGWDICPCLILKSSITDEMLRLMFETSADNSIMYRGVLLLNQNPNFKVIAVRTDIVNWVSLKMEERGYKLLGAFPLHEAMAPFLMFRDIKIKTVMKDVYSRMGPCLVADLYALKGTYWCAFFVAPWRQKFHFLITGHWELFKRILQKLIHLDFKIKGL